MANVLSIVSYNILPASLGGQKGIHLFNKYLGIRHNIICVSIKNNDASKADGYIMLPILSNSKLRYINIFYFFSFRRLVRQYRISHVILEHPYYGWLGIMLKWFCGIKLIIHSHNIEAHRFKSLGNWWWRLVWVYEKYTHRLADATFNISREDRQYMIDHFKMKAEKCTVISYGIERDSTPSPEQKLVAKKTICEQLQISPENILYFFNGTLDYPPNLNGVRNILYEILPRFKPSFPFKIIICGKDLPSEYNSLKEYAAKNLIYAGFVEDINLYFTATDVFINSVTDGGGIKTKLVEGLAHDLTAVSTRNGAYGVDPQVCNGKLLIAENGNWDSFIAMMTEAKSIKSHINEDFFDQFNWKEITKRASGVIDGLGVMNYE